MEIDSVYFFFSAEQNSLLSTEKVDIFAVVMHSANSSPHWICRIQFIRSFCFVSILNPSGERVVTMRMVKKTMPSKLFRINSVYQPITQDNRTRIIQCSKRKKRKHTFDRTHGTQLVARLYSNNCSINIESANS